MPVTANQPQSSSREAVLTAALELFLQRGFAATRVADVAERAGVGKGSVYLHVRNKQELFAAVVDAGVIARIEQAEMVADDFSGSATELLTTLLNNNLIEFWGSQSSGIYKLIIAESQQFPELAAVFYRTVTRRARKLFETILQLGIDRCEYRAMDVSYTARIIVDALDNELLLAHSLGEHDDKAFDSQRFITALLALVAVGLIRPGEYSGSSYKDTRA
jgi:AcrR family transcriptional regulator